MSKKIDKSIDELICEQLRRCKGAKEIVEREDLIEGLVTRLRACTMNVEFTQSLDRIPQITHKNPIVVVK